MCLEIAVYVSAYMWETRFDPWVRKILWRGKWHPTPVLLPGKSHGQRSIVGYSPRGCKESDTTEAIYHTNTRSKFIPIMDSLIFWISCSIQFSSVAQSCLTLCDPMIVAHQASLSITNSQSSLRFMSIDSVMPSSHLILCHPLLLLPSVSPSISLFQWVNSSHEVANVLEFQL